MGSTNTSLFEFDQQAALAELSGLPFSTVRAELGHRPVGFRFIRHIVNISAKLPNLELLVTGEANDLKLAQAKAGAELLERSMMLKHGAKTSNGWAAHPEHSHAKLNAIFELVERDAVLSQWLSATPFRQISPSELPADLQSWVRAELAQSEYPELVVLVSTKGLGPSVSCILRNSQGFGVSAHATRSTFTESIHAALAEACRAAHATLRREYWRDTLKLKAGALEDVHPGAHSVYYAYHEPFPTWIVGAPLSFLESDAEWNSQIEFLLNCIDQFTFTTVLNSPLFVGFAKHPQALELYWGSTRPQEILCSAGAKRLNLEIINTETHIVA